ncbi:MAG TPA: histidine kinase N-terminal 7TM domain-containing protein [Parvibaculum sp.]
MFDQPFALDVYLPLIVLLWGALVAPVIAYRTWRLPAFPGQNAFLVMLPSSLWWSVSAAIETMVTTPEAKFFWAEMAWLGVLATPTCWGVFVWAYIYGRYERLTTGWIVTLSVMPVATWIVALTNSYHHLIYISGTPYGGVPGAQLHYVHGLWYVFASAYAYLYLSATVVMIAKAAWDSTGIYRRHYLGLLAAMLGPWAFNIGYQTGTFAIGGFDPTPFSFIVTGSIFFWLIQRNQFFSLVPVARSMLLNTIPDLVLVLDRRQVVVEANPAVLALPEIPRALVGKALADVPPLETALRRCLAGPANAVDDIMLGGQYFEVRRTPLIYLRREVGQLLVMREITRRRAIEDELRHAKVRAERALDAQRQVMREQRNFLSMIGHEFRTPLSIISSASQLLSMDDNSPETARELSKIARAINRMVDLIDACLADDRLESAALLFRPRVVNLTELVAEACIDRRAASENRDLRFDGSAPVSAECDGTTISVVVSNLLDNALKYSPADKPVDVTVSAESGTARIEVADHGPGIDPGEKRAIFEKFYRSNRAEHVPGAGLGLYLVGRIVELHHGRIDVLERPGGGSRFVVSLPVRHSLSA